MRESSTGKYELGLRTPPEAQSSSGYTRCPLIEPASDISRTNRVDHSVANSPEVDFALVLARTIDSIMNDPSLLRNTVYELARTRLAMFAWEQNPRMTVLELRRMMRSFETAIEYVESHASRQDELLPLPGTADFVTPAHLVNSQRDRGHPVFVLDQRVNASEIVDFRNSSSYSHGVSRARKRGWNWPRAAVVLRAGFVSIVIMAAFVIGGKYVASDSHAPALVHASTGVIPKSDSQIAKLVPQAQSPSKRQLPDLPIPDAYGVYAVDNGELNELEALPGRVPDPRVFMSTPVKTPSRTTLPDGRLSFIVFRRDLTTSAPDRVAVRVIAKVMRGMTFESAAGASVTKLDDQWAIRGTSYDLRVTPLKENPEMLLLRPENPDFVFPAGRYGLVLKGQAFDFSVAGPITEPVQCLEHVAAANGSFYSECRSP